MMLLHGNGLSVSNPSKSPTGKTTKIRNKHLRKNYDEVMMFGQQHETAKVTCS